MRNIMNILILYNMKLDLNRTYHLSELGVGYTTLNLMDLIIIHNDKFMSIAKNIIGDDTGQLLPQEMLIDYIAEWAETWNAIKIETSTDDDDTTDWGDQTKNLGG
jgi:hypothetical protein